MPDKLLDAMDHVAIQVESIERAVKWYTEHFNCEVAYQDESWALLQFENIKLAFVLPKQHPAHIGFRVSTDRIPAKLSTRRDGERTTYTRDSEGNMVEWLAPLEPV